MRFPFETVLGSLPAVASYIFHWVSTSLRGYLKVRPLSGHPVRPLQASGKYAGDAKGART